jgi:antitoxin VapB
LGKDALRFSRFSGMDEFYLFMEEFVMNLNIKSVEAHRLALELAKETGESMTSAVTKALRAELRRVRNVDERRARIDAITQRTADILKGGPGSADIDALLYDDMGLPR